MGELRAATPLARLWHSQDKTAEARDLLAPILGWITEGFDTNDFMEAKALLEELSWPPRLQCGAHLYVSSWLVSRFRNF